MDSFSVTSLTTLASTISTRTLSCAEELTNVTGTAEPQHDAAPLISGFAKALRELHERAALLDEALNSAAVFSEGLRANLSKWLNACDHTTGVLNKQILRLQPETLDRLEPFFVNVYVKTVVGYARLFHSFVTLLSKTERADQDAALDAPDFKDIRGQLRLALRQASQARSILHEHDSTDAYSSRTTGPVPGTHTQPPPYEAPSPTIPGPSDGESSSSPFAAGFSSLTESFKAFAAGFKSKPDPFVIALCEATRRGDVQQMNGFLAQEANINGRNDEGHTPLTCAVLANQTEAVQSLISAGADHTSWDKSKMPPLFLAASIGNIDVARVLLQKGGKMNEKNWSGQPFFAEVCSGENLAGIRFLLENGANANTTNISGRHIIVPPVKSGNVELVRMLLTFGANANAKDISGNHILALAANTENWDMVKLLLDRGANANGKTVNGITVFVDLVNKKRYAMARELLERGADADARDLHGQRVLVTVIKNSDMPQAEKVDLVRALLIHGASADASDTTHNSPAICHAMDLGNNDIVGLLLRHNAKTNKKMRSGETLLLSAIDQGRTEQAKLLLDHGADPNATDKKGRTPLLQAIVRQDLELIAALKQHGADVNLVGAVTPADLAACAGRPEIFSLLGLAVPVPAMVTPQAGPARRASGPARQSSPPPNYNAVTGKM